MAVLHGGDVSAESGGLQAQDALWDYLSNDLVVLHAPVASERQRMRALMHQYEDTPMDLADASLVAASEQTRLRVIFTVDSHFRAYRIDGIHAFEVVP